MTKGEMETLVFYLLQQSGSFDGMSNFDISLSLEVSEAKVRSMAYNAELKYADHSDADFRLLDVLTKSYIHKLDNDRFQFAIEDKFIQRFLYSKLKKINHYADTSFNTELVTMSREALSALLYNYDTEASRLFDEECEEYADRMKPSEILSNLISSVDNVVSIIDAFKPGAMGAIAALIKKHINA